MKVLIELPTWLGDTVMVTPAIGNLAKEFGNIEITLLGSQVSIEVLKNHPNVIKSFILDKSFLNIYTNYRNFGEFDFFLSFRGSYRTKIISFFIKSNFFYQFKKKKYKGIHQVIKYNNFINNSFKLRTNPGQLKLNLDKTTERKNKNKLLGINPGASYGSAKRWYPEEFALLAKFLSKDYDIIIFGSSKEVEIAKDIENCLILEGIDNFQNFAGKTSIAELTQLVSNIDLFITGDSGTMHIAAAFQIPTVAIFGPTSEIETSQWMNKKSLIVKKDLECQPCFKRVCPLKHHKCMRDIKYTDVISEIKALEI
jgi:heptosyltransferase II